MKRSGAYELAGPLGLLVAVVALVYLPIFSGEIFFFRDAAHWVHPARLLLREGFAHGELPLWNSREALGFSTLADPLYGLFYPPNLLYLVAPVIRVETWLLFGHTLLGGVGAALLARRFGARGVALTVAGIAWALAGQTGSMWNVGVMLETNAWIPWCGVGFVELSMRHRDRPRALAGAVAVAALGPAMILLHGELFVAILAVGFGVACALVVALTGESHAAIRWRRLGVGTSLAIVLAVTTGAASWLPAVRAASATARSKPLAREVAEEASLHPLRLVELAAPGAMGYPYGDFPGEEITREAIQDGRPYTYSVYLGASVIGLALLSLGRRRRAATALALLMMVTLCIAMGRHTPLHAVVRTLVPPLAYMRSPQKYLALTVTFGAVLAALGVERLRALDKKPVPWVRLSLFILTMVFVLIIGNLATPHALAPFVVDGAIHGAIAGVVLLLAVLLARGRARLAVGLCVACVAIDLALPTWNLQLFAPADIETTRPPAADRVLADAAAHPGSGPPRLFRPDAVEETLNRFAPTRTVVAGEVRYAATLLANGVTTFGIGTVPGYDAAIPSAFSSLWSRGAPRGREVLQLLSVDYAILPVGIADVPSGFTPLEDVLPGARLFRVDGALPRAFVVSAAEPCSDDEALDHLFDREVLDGSKAWLAPDAAAAINGAAGRAGSCAIERDEGRDLIATCEADRDGLAVFVEQYDAGWRVTIDGAPAPLARVNLVMRGVRVTRGSHRIVMRFAPSVVAPALALSLIGMLVLGILLALGRSGRAEGASYVEGESPASTS